MEKLTRLTAEHRDNLAAYLDGELDDSQTQHIETVLAQSTVARNDVELLAKTYDLLDLLPRPRASGEFSEKTLAIAKLAEQRPDFRQTSIYRQGRRGMRWAGWAALLAAVSATSFAIARFQIPSEDDALLDNLQAMKRLDKYMKAGNLQFLQQLGREEKLMDRMKSESDHAAQ
jgi:anti-sigma factor RsiW